MMSRDRATKPLEKLNPGQLKAATVENNALVWAGPGTGKTQITASRAGWLIETGRCVPHELLVVTFTNRAVREFKQRLVSLLGSEVANQIRVSTFHSLALSLVEIQQQLGDRERFRLLNSEGRIGLLEELIRDYLRRHPQSVQIGKANSETANLKKLVEQVGQLVSSLKAQPAHNSQANRSNTTSQAIGNDWFIGEPLWKLAYEVLPQYEQHLSAKGLLDLDDLIPEAILTLKKWPKLVRLPGIGVRQVLLDETQDTSPGQLDLLLTLMAASQQEQTRPENKNQPQLVAVGDERQQIYGHLHNGPYIKLTESLQQTTRLNLDIQYRYGPTINQVATAISWRLGCDLSSKPARLLDDSALKFAALFTEEKLSQGQLPLTIYQAEDEVEEATFVAEEILRIRKCQPQTQVAVLVRTHVQGEQMGRVLKGAGISYHTLTSTEFKADLNQQAVSNNHQKSISDLDQAEKTREVENSPVVTISTIHASKGAEFEVVFIPGLAQGLFPFSQTHLLEDMRLFFVAITRARYLVYLSYPARYRARKSFGVGERAGEADELKTATPSVFLSILP